jgi:hypothetical protein
MASFVRPIKTRSCWLQALPLGLCLLLLGQCVWAQIPGTFLEGSGYDGSGNLDPNNIDPLIDYTTPIIATTFVNGANGVSSTFEFDYPSGVNWLQYLYYGWQGTLNFTNYGEMDSIYGFNFENQTRSQNHGEAANFYNKGVINCGTTIGSVLIVNSVTSSGVTSAGYGGFNLWATNILIDNNGAINVGSGGLARIVGNHVSLNSASVAIQGVAGSLLGTSVPFISAVGQTASSTNAWVPNANLTQNTAFGPMNQSPINQVIYTGLQLVGSLPYFTAVTNSSGTNVIVRMIFLQDSSSFNNVVANVYVDPSVSTTTGTGTGYVEWAGTYIDPATGQVNTSYLYLNDDFIAGSSTNILKYASPGVPANYTFTTSTTPLALGAPLPALFPTGLLDSDLITNNIYSYVDATFITTSVSTNQPTGYVPINYLPGRVEITASNDLNLTQADITGMNYLLIRSTNQFEYSQSEIAAPFSDLYLGSTNGNLAVTNLIQSTLPIWSGTVQAWNTRWFYVDTNAIVNGTNTPVTYDFRVMLVASDVSPTSSSQVSNFGLYNSNNVVLSDALNISSSVYMNCTNLLLTYNGTGTGAGSPEGELIIDYAPFTWINAFPRLRCLTNNGLIFYPNAVQINGSSTIANVTPPVPAVVATGMLSEMPGRTNVLVNNKVTIGTNIYNFVTKLTNTLPNQVKIATKFDGSLSNLIAAINHTAGAGTNYSTNTPANSLVTAGGLTFAVVGGVTNHEFMVTAKTVGSSGNLIVTTNSAVTTNLTWNGQSKLSGGVDYVAGTTNISTVAAPYLDFVNSGDFEGQSATIWANDFENYGVIYIGGGIVPGFYTGSSQLTVLSLNTTMTGGIVEATGPISLSASNLMLSGTTIYSGSSLALIATNLLTDGGVANGNIWVLDANYPGSGNPQGLILPIKPAFGDLLGTTISNLPPVHAGSSTVITYNVWAGQDRGYSNSGFLNNAAIGQYVLDATNNTKLSFAGTGTGGVTNAIYVDCLYLEDSAGYNNFVNNNNPALVFSTNLVIYYAQAISGGSSVAEKLNHANGDHLRWVSSYAGAFSSTYYTYPDGNTYAVNAALAAANDLDSDRDGNNNSTDPTPILVPSQLNFTLTVTNRHPLSARIQWRTIPLAGNSVYYSTNLLSTNWLPFTNFNNYYYGTGTAVTNAAHSNYFVSPQPYISNAHPADNWEATNVWIFDPLTNVPHYYRVQVQPN